MKKDYLMLRKIDMSEVVHERSNRAYTDNEMIKFDHFISTNKSYLYREQVNPSS